MKSNIRMIKKCPAFKKEFISFDKKGKKVITTKEITDCYLVVLNDGSSVAMNKEQLKMYGINATLPDTKETIVSQKPLVVDDIEDDLDEIEEENATPNISTVMSATNNTSTNVSPIVIK